MGNFCGWEYCQRRDVWARRGDVEVSHDARKWCGEENGKNVTSSEEEEASHCPNPGEYMYMQDMGIEVGVASRKKVVVNFDYSANMNPTPAG